MPGLIRGMARTAAIVGTATATRNYVDRKQADKNYAAYSQAVQQNAPPPQQQQAAAPPPQQYAPPPPEPAYQAPPPPPPPSEEDVVSQLERLGALKQQGLLTDEEFNAQKKKLLGM